MKKILVSLLLVLVLSLVSGLPLQAGYAETRPADAGGCAGAVVEPADSDISRSLAVPDRLISSADLIIQGLVTRTSGAWNAEGTAIYTTAVISVETLIKGAESLKEVSVVVPGGRVGEINLTVSGAPVLGVNARAVFFLQQNPDATFSLLNWEESVYLIWEDRVAGETAVPDFVRAIWQNMENSGLALPPGAADYAPAEPSILAAELDPADTESAPVITAIIPDSGSTGTNTQVIIRGSNFGDVQDSSSVTFFYRTGQPRIEATVLYWNDTSIAVILPAYTINDYPASAGSGDALVTTAAGDSNTYHYDISFSYGGARWTAVNPVVHYRINPDGTAEPDSTIEAIQAAAQTWSTVSGSRFQYVYDGASDATGYAYNGINEVLWGDVGSSGTLASTYRWDDTAGNIKEFDLVFNSSCLWETVTGGDGYDIQTITTHELGHALGLMDLYGDGGSPDDTAKVMYGRAGAGEDKRALTAADIEGLCWVYPDFTALAMGAGGLSPTAIGVNAVTDRVYAANFDSNNVLVLDGTSGEVLTSIRVGSGPQGIAVNSNTNEIYVSNTSVNTVSVIDGATNSVSDTIIVGSNPYRLAVDQTNNLVYVTNNYSNSVSVIDGATHTVTATIGVEENPCGVGLNPLTGQVFVCNDGNGVDSISVIDAATNSVTDTYYAGSGPGGIQVDPQSGYLYVANYSDDTLSVIDGGSGHEEAVLDVGNGPRGVAFDAVTHRVYVANYLDNSVSVIDTDNLTVVETLAVGSYPWGIEVNTQTNRIYSANNGDNSISVIDGADGSVQELPTSSVPYGVAVNSALDRVYVANYKRASVAVLDGSDGSLVTTVRAGSQPSGLAVNPATNRVYAANFNSSSVSVIDGDNNTWLEDISVGSRPYAVGVDPLTGRVYAANYSGNSVSVIDADNNTVLATIPVGTGPRGIGVNPETNLIYVSIYSSKSVSIIDGASGTVTGSVTVGKWPSGVAVNTETNLIYVANYGSDTVSVIDGAGAVVTAEIPVGDGPRAVAVDPGTNHIYVANYVNDCVSVIDGDTNIVVATYNTGDGTQGIGIDPDRRRIYAANYLADTLSMIEDSSLQPTWLSLETAADGSGETVGELSLKTGKTLTVYAVSRDRYHNYVGNPEDTVWSLTNLSGGLDESALSALNGSSVTLTGGLAGAGVIHAENGDLTAADSGLISVYLMPPAILSLATEPQTGASVDDNFTVQPVVLVSDEEGDPVNGVTISAAADNGTLRGTLSAVSDTAGRAAFSDLGFNKAGTPFNLTFTYTDLAVNSPSLGPLDNGTAVQVRVETLADGSGTVVAAQKLAVGSSLTAYALARDQFDNYAGSVEADWSLIDCTGSVQSGDLSYSWGNSTVMTGNKTGSGILQAAVNGLTSVNSGTITVYTKSSGGGGGGGGGGDTNLTVYSSGFAVNTQLKTNSSGVLQSAARLQTADGGAALSLNAGTKMLTTAKQVLTSIRVTTQNTPAAAPLNRSLLKAYTFGPAGAQFDPAVTLTFTYDPEQLPEGTPEDGLAIGWFDGSEWQMLETSLDPDQKSAAAKITHFSDYALIATIDTEQPAITEPAVTEPAVTEPAVTEPAATSQPEATQTPAASPTPTPSAVATAEPVPSNSTTAASTISVSTAQVDSTGLSRGALIGVVAGVIVVVLIVIGLVVRRKKS